VTEGHKSEELEVIEKKSRGKPSQEVLCQRKRRGEDRWSDDPAEAWLTRLHFNDEGTLWGAKRNRRGLKGRFAEKPRRRKSKSALEGLGLELRELESKIPGEEKQHPRGLTRAKKKNFIGTREGKSVSRTGESGKSQIKGNID